MRKIVLHNNTLVYSDDDLEYHWASIYTGFDENMNFIIALNETFDNYDHYEEIHHIERKGKRYEEIYTYAELDRDNTAILCQVLGTSLLNLSDAVYDEFNDPYPSYTPSAVKSKFKDITEYLVDIGCKFIVKVETAHHG